MFYREPLSIFYNTMKLKVVGKKAALGMNKTFRMKGLSRKEYPFEYDSELKAYVYDAKTQEEIDDIFHASIKLYRHFDFIPLLEEAPKAEAPKTKPKKAKVASEKVEV